MRRRIPFRSTSGTLHPVSQVEQRRSVRVAVERLRYPLSAARDEDRQRIPVRPTRPMLLSYLYYEIPLDQYNNFLMQSMSFVRNCR